MFRFEGSSIGNNFWQAEQQLEIKSKSTLFSVRSPTLLYFDACVRLKHFPHMINSPEEIDTKFAVGLISHSYNEVFFSMLMLIRHKTRCYFAKICENFSTCFSHFAFAIRSMLLLEIVPSYLFSFLRFLLDEILLYGCFGVWHEPNEKAASGSYMVEKVFLVRHQWAAGVRVCEHWLYSDVCLGIFAFDYILHK